MPRGVPKAGFRKTTAMLQRIADMNVDYIPPVSTETDEEISARLSERFEILDIMTESCIYGRTKALIISGPPGLGKSFQIEKALYDYDATGSTYINVKGYVRATGLIKLLYTYRHTGNIIVFDDADSIFYDDISLNILKAVCDSTEHRTVSWLSEGRLIDDDTGEMIPRSFAFNGSIVFITNLDFEHMIERGHKLAPHLQALQSRAHYLDLTLKNRRDYLIRIKDVIRNGMLKDVEEVYVNDIVNFVEENYDNLRELSLRSIIKLTALRQSNLNWRRIAKIMLCK